MTLDGAEKRVAKATECQALFGGKKAWCADEWTSSDDRVRGGQSESHLEISEDAKTARFYGTLDISTLGGAGFASQRTVDQDGRHWDLSGYAGIKLDFASGDKKRYTFNLKDELLPPNPDNGREQSTVSWECDFELPPQSEPGRTHDKSVFIPWDSFTATYRGKVKKDAKPLDLEKIQRMSIMMRSFFGSQEGDFELCIKSITAEPDAPPPRPSGIRRSSKLEAFDVPGLESGAAATEQPRHAFGSDLGLIKIRFHSTPGLAIIATAAFITWTLFRFMS